MSDNLNNINEKQKNTRITIAQTAVLMAVLTLVSKLLGFIREMVFAGFFGTSYIVDSYVLAQNIPIMLFGGIFASIGTAYMPTFSGIVEKKGNEAGNKFTNQVLNLALIFAIIAFIIGFLFSEQLVSIIAPKFSVEATELTVFYLRITFGYAIFACGAGIFDAYLQYRGRFLHPIVSGYFQNFGIITVAIISAFTNHYFLAIGIVAGHGCRFIYVFIMAHKDEYKYKLEFAVNEPVKQILTLAIPVFFGTYISQLNSFVDKSLASGLQEGSISALNYGMMLVTLITGLTTAIIATIIYPKITKAVSNNDWDFFNMAVEKGMTIIVMIAVPFSLGAIAFAEQVVQVVYERGAFDEAATALTGSAFLFYSVGLAFMALGGFLNQVYYSMRDMKTPIICSAISVIVNICLNLLFVESLAHKGLALATSLAMVVNFILLYRILIRRYKEVRIFSSKKKLVKICIAAIIAVVGAITIYAILMNLILLPQVIYLISAVVVACGIYLLLLIIFKIDEVKILKQLKG